MKNKYSNNYEKVSSALSKTQTKWLVTGVAGFIGSNLLEELLRLNQKVIGLDNFSTGYAKNLEEVEQIVGKEKWGNFELINGDIRDLKLCRSVVNNVNHVLHQAALGSVPRSIEDPITTNDCNINGFLNMLVASKDARVDSFTYASSSSVYGDSPTLPKEEANVGKQLSPYAATKFTNELYADVFFKSYNFNSTGFRYFNVFGERQDPDGSYAAVIPKWCSALLNSKDLVINGDGETSRDFCYVKNIVSANILSAVSMKKRIGAKVYNVAVGERTTLNELAEIIATELEKNGIKINSNIIHQNFRDGDVRHSLADCSKIKKELGYFPLYKIEEGIKLAVKWYASNLHKNR